MHDVRPIECDRTRLVLSVALDERPSPFELALASAHVRECDACSLFEARVELLTRALREAPPARLQTPVQLPARTSIAWRSAARATSVGAAAAVAVLAFVGFAAAPDRTSWRESDALIASALDRPAGTNELLIDVYRPALVAHEPPAPSAGAGGIGAHKPPLQPGA